MNPKNGAIGAFNTMLFVALVATEPTYEAHKKFEQMKVTEK